jgi:hypothetical protein
MLNFSIACGKTAHGLARDWKVQTCQTNIVLKSKLISTVDLQYPLHISTGLGYWVRTNQLETRKHPAC